MNSFIEDSIEKTFSLVKYYLLQSQWRQCKSYIGVAANYCNDLFNEHEFPQEIRDKAFYLRGICYLMLGKDEDYHTKEQCYLEAVAMFLKLKTISLGTPLYGEFDIDETLFDELFSWSRSRIQHKVVAQTA